MMQTSTTAKPKATQSFTPVRSPLLQRKCACGNSAGLTGTCSDCQTQNLTLQRRSIEPTKGAAVLPLVHELLPIQTKLTIGKPGDRHEQEADQIADRVMRMPEPSIQRQIEPEEEEEEGMVQRKAIRADAQANANANQVAPLDQQQESSEVPTTIHEVLRSQSQPLDPVTRAFMEPRFSHDFSHVRVHTDAKAAESAREVNALAYTVGRDVVFGTRQYDPVIPAGKRLLAHELTHVVQQESTRVSSLQRKEAPKETPKKTPKETKSAASGACGGKSLASGIAPSDKRLNGQLLKVELPADTFGNTSKFGADFQFSACKVGKTWRFQLNALVVPVGSRVQDVTFRKDVGAASDSIVTKQSYPGIVRDLSPTRTQTFSLSCSGKQFEDKTTTSSRRKTFWKHQFVIDHEAFHRKNWVDMYRPELIKAESEVWAHSIPESEAKDTATAVSKANKDLTNYMTDAAQRVCSTYTPQQESSAYDAGAPAYQKLVDEIEARAKKEKW
jgi:hypothetical protein